MANMVHINMRDLEYEAMTVVKFYEKQQEAFRVIKKAAENVQWADANYDAFVDSMNIIGMELSKILQSLTDGDEVYMITELLQRGQDYLENEKMFPLL